jgi:hypothetical protein
MRWLRLCGLLFGLAAGALPTPAITANPADGPGCLGVLAEECVRWLRATMTLDENFLANAMAHRHDTDVNGRPIGGGLVTVYAKLPGQLDSFVILLYLRPDDTVLRVESNLRRSLNDARTEQAYDQSALYEIVSRLLGRRCPGISKLDLYRFFENSVKPRIKAERQDFSGGFSGLHRQLSHASGAPYCGVTFGYTDLLEWRGAKESQAAAKRKNFSSIELQ